MSIGQRIKGRRLELKLSADELGAMLGKDRSTVYRYENGYIETLPLEVLEPLAKALQTTPQYLMGWEEERQKNDARADVINRMLDDKDFLSLVERLSKLDDTQLRAVTQLLAAFLE